jgi:hypothetical protein
MKVLALIVVIGAVLGVGFMMKPQVIEVVNPEPEVKKEEVQVDALEQAIKDAQNAKRAEIESIATKAYDDAHRQEMKKVELEVVKSFNEKLEARQIELEKETKLF